MLRQLSRQHPMGIKVILTGWIGLFFAIAILGISPLMILAGLSGIVFIVVVLKWPEMALLGILLMSSTIFDIYAFPSISLGFGRLILYDIVVIVPLAVILVKALVSHHFKLFYTPLDLPLLGFYGVALASTAIAIFQKSFPVNQSLGEIRVVNGYLTFFIVTYSIRDEKRLRRLLKGILFLSIFVAISMIVQYGVGSSIKILAGRVEDVGTAGVTSQGITRILPPGQSLVMVGFITTIILLIIEGTRTPSLSRLFQAVVFGFAVLLTFNRNFWVAIGLAMLITASLIRFRNKVRLLAITLTTLLIAIALIPAISSVDPRFGRLVDAAASRFSTLFNSNTMNEGSLEYRYVENSYALPQIASHPFLGLGLGGYYRPWDRRLDPKVSDFVYERRAYIHDGYLWVVLKTGLIGFFILAWLISQFLKRGLQKWQHITDPFLRAVVLSSPVTVLGLLASAFVNPIFDSYCWSPVLGVLLAANEVIYGISADRSQALIIPES